MNSKAIVSSIEIAFILRHECLRLNDAYIVSTAGSAWLSGESAFGAHFFLSSGMSVFMNVNAIVSSIEMVSILRQEHVHKYDAKCK